MEVSCVLHVMRLNCLVQPLRTYFRQYKSVISKPATCKLSRKLGILFNHGHCSEEESIEKYMLFSNPNSASKEIMMRDMRVIDDFLSEEEERSLHEEVEPHVRKLRYEFDHWDDAIHGYRETERLHWNSQNTDILQRVRVIAFPPGTPQLSLVHVLDLSEEGVIKPHIDSVRFCGNTIAGLSLLSDSVMRLVHEKDKEEVVDILLKRRSLYIMKNTARYEFTHEILGNAYSKFGDQIIPRRRRISVICRNEADVNIGN